ncbi:unnamed protein product, partial [Mesorhabditis spiculigera]
AMLGPFEELDALQQTIWMDLANAAHNHLTQEGSHRSCHWSHSRRDRRLHVHRNWHCNGGAPMSYFDDDHLTDPVLLDRWEDNDAWDRAYEEATGK